MYCLYMLMIIIRKGSVTGIVEVFILFHYVLFIEDYLLFSPKVNLLSRIIWISCRY